MPTQTGSIDFKSTKGFQSYASGQYTTKTEFNSLEIGGRNLLRTTADYSGWLKSDGVTTVDGDVLDINVSGKTSNTFLGARQWLTLSSAELDGSTIVVSFEVYSDDWASVTSDQAAGFQSTVVQVATTTKPYGSTTNDQKRYRYMSLGNTALWSELPTQENGKWLRFVSIPLNIPADLTNADLSTDVGPYIIITPILRRNGHVRFRRMKVERGNKATDWTPAPEDLDAHFESVETAIEQNAEAIKLSATKEEVEKTYSTKDEAQIDRSGSGTSVAIDGAATASLKSLHVLGESVQDGTPTPSAPVAIRSVAPNIAVTPYTHFDFRTSRGVTYTQNADGSITATGTATSYAYLGLCNQSDNPFGLERGKTYAIVVSSRNVTVMTVTGGSSINKFALVTIPASGNWTVGVGVLTGVTVNETFRFSVFESEALVTSAVPYGSIGISVRGKNLWPTIPSATNSGVTWVTGDDGTVTLNGTATATVNIEARFIVPYAGTYRIIGCPSGGGASTYQLWTYDYDTPRDAQITDTGDGGTGTLTAGHTIALRLRVQNGYTCNNVIVKPQITFGEDDVDYEIYSESVTPIPLNGHELRSLPDGTRDELTVDVDGHVTMTQRVGVTVSSDFSQYNSSNGYVAYQTANVPSDCASATEANSRILCSWTTTNESFNSSNMTKECVQFPFGTTVTRRTYVAALQGRDMSDFLLLYPLTTPQTIDLGTIDMPQVKDGDTVEVIAALTPSIDVTWWASAGQAVADAYASLSSAIEVRAESIVSTVSERYATSDEVKAISSQIEQTAQGWGIQFKNLLGTPTDGQSTEGMTLAKAFEQLGVTKGNLEQIRSYVRIAEETVDNQTYPVLLMGSANSPIMLALSNKALEFRHGDEKVAYIDVNGDTQEGMLHITRAVVVKELQFGSWKWFERDGVGNLALKWVGDE